MTTYPATAPLPPSATERHPFLAKLEEQRNQYHSMLERIESAARDRELTLREFFFLEVVTSQPGQRQTEIGQQLGLDRTTIMNLLDRLETRDLARRDRYPGDRRSWAVVPTSEGRELVESIISGLD